MTLAELSRDLGWKTVFAVIPVVGLSGVVILLLPLGMLLLMSQRVLLYADQRTRGKQGEQRLRGLFAIVGVVVVLFALSLQGAIAIADLR